jgi:hypothetical protein
MKYLELFEVYIKSTKTARSKYIKAMNILTIEECVEYIINNCNEFINRPVYITRYLNKMIGDETVPFFSDPIDRISRDNSNHYTLLIDNSDAWKNYPKRGKSFISTLQNGEFLDYNPPILDNRYLVIPNDYSKWGICPTDDIFTSFKTLKIYGIYSYKIFEELNIFSKYLGLGGIRDSNIDDMKSDILKLQKYINNNPILLKNRNYNIIILMLLKNYGHDIWCGLIDLFDPSNNNFKLEKYTSLNYDNNSHEVWTDSTCLFIPMIYLNDFLKKLRDKTKKEILL